MALSSGTEANTGTNFASFAYMEICLILAKMHYEFDLELMDKNPDWETQSRIHMMWWKPKLPIRFTPATEKM